LGFGFTPLASNVQLPQTRLAPNGLRVYEPEVRARQLRLPAAGRQATDVTERRVAEGTFAAPTKEGWHGACPHLYLKQAP